jgi:hypothetical protein
MFEHLRLMGSTEDSIVLHTRRRRCIKNHIDVPPSYQHLQKYQRLLKMHPWWVERMPPIGGYNCAGHV